YLGDVLALPRDRARARLNAPGRSAPEETARDLGGNKGGARRQAGRRHRRTPPLLCQQPLSDPVQGRQVPLRGTFRVDTGARPAAIDFEHTEGALKGKVWKGINALDGDTLTTCDNGLNPDKGRPTAFEAKAGSGCVLITFKRARPQDPADDERAVTQ